MGPFDSAEAQQRDQQGRGAVYSACIFLDATEIWRGHPAIALRREFGSFAEAEGWVRTAVHTIPLTEPQGIVAGPDSAAADLICGVGSADTHLIATAPSVARAMASPELCPSAGCGDGVARIEADGVPSLWLCEDCLQSFSIMAAAVVAIRRYTTPVARA